MESNGNKDVKARARIMNCQRGHMGTRDVVFDIVEIKERKGLHSPDPASPSAYSGLALRVVKHIHETKASGSILVFLASANQIKLAVSKLRDAISSAHPVGQLLTFNILISRDVDGKATIFYLEGPSRGCLFW